MSDPALDDRAPLPPHNLDAEESVIGAMMLSSYAIDTCSEILRRGDFYRASHGELFEVMCEMHAAGEPVDAITVADTMQDRNRLAEVGGTTRIHELATIVPTTSNVGTYAKRVRAHAIRRELRNAGHWIEDYGMNGAGPVEDLVEQAEKLVFDIAQSRQRSDFVTVGDALDATITQIEETAARGDEFTGLASGLAVIDRLTAGFQPGNLIVVAARPSMGKSGLALTVAKHVAVEQGKPVALFTMEMSRWEVTQRLLGAHAFLDSQKLRNGRLDRDEWKRLYDAHAALKGSPLLIDDLGSASAMEIRAKARRAQLRHPDLALVVVDYLQLMSSGTNRFESRQQEVSQISRSLKLLAAELAVPIVALSQLSRACEQRHDKRPILSDLRESGAIEQDADVVMFLYRDEYYNPETALEDGTEGVAEVNVAKQRNGPTGLAKLSFVKKFAAFSDLSAL